MVDNCLNLYHFDHGRSLGKTPPVLCVIYFVYSWSQAQKNKKGCGRLITSIRFSHFSMNGSTANTCDLSNYFVEDP